MLSRKYLVRFDRYRQSIIDIYKANGKSLDPTGADREIIANFTSEMMFNEKGNTLERFINEVNSEDRNAISQFIHDFISWLKARLKGEKASFEITRLENRFAAVLRNVDNTNAQKNNTTNDGDVQYALRIGAKNDVEKALNNKNYTEDVYLTESSPSIIASQKGVRNLPMLMKASHIRENVFTEQEAKKIGLKVNKNINYHGLGKDLFLKIIDGLDKVTLAYRGTKNAKDSSRRENCFLLISQYKDANGNTVNVPVYIDEVGQYNRVFIETNKIATVFGRDNFNEYINREIVNGNLVRIKNKSIQASELTSPINASYSKNAFSNPNVSQDTPEVNTHYTQESENYSSLEQNNDGNSYSFEITPEQDAEYQIYVESWNKESAQKNG